MSFAVLDRAGTSTATLNARAPATNRSRPKGRPGAGVTTSGRQWPATDRIDPQQYGVRNPKNSEGR